MKKRVRWSPLLLVVLLAGCSFNATKEQNRSTSLDQLSSLRQKAEILYANKQYSKALGAYLELEKTIDNDAEIQFRLGNVYSKLHQPDQAIESYRKALLLNPRMSKAWHNMGVIQLRQSANTWVQMVSEISPDDPLLPKAVHFSREILEVLDSEPE